MAKKPITLKQLLSKVNRNETKIRLTNRRITRLVDAIDKSRRVKGI